jgi:hypothetical protein
MLIENSDRLHEDKELRSNQNILVDLERDMEWIAEIIPKTDSLTIFIGTTILSKALRAMILYLL